MEWDRKNKREIEKGREKEREDGKSVYFLCFGNIQRVR